jgi:hypothetical protein
MSNEEQFDDRVKRMFQGESIAPPASLEERLFAQLAPSPWPKRLGLSMGVFLVCGAGWWGALSDPEVALTVPSLETASEITSATETEVLPLVSDGIAPKASVESLQTMVSSEDEGTSARPTAEKHVPRVTDQQSGTDLSTKNQQALESLERLPVGSIPLENTEESTLQKSNEDQWVLPAVVKLKN